jgi:PAS domain S-box-containing protein
LEFTVETANAVFADVWKERKIRVLHVDDDAEFLAVTKQVLEEQGEFQVDTALSAEDALKKLKSSEYDALVVDYQMPGKTGLELLRELKQERIEIPFVLLTCKGKAEIAIEALNSGVERYIDKQGDPESTYAELKRTIRNAVKKRRIEQTLKESEEKYRKLFEEALDAIFVADPETGLIVDCNRAATELTGRSKAELIGMHQRFLHPPEDTVGECSKTFAEHRLGREGVFETQIITKSGEIRDVATKATFVEIHGVRMLQGIFRDITESKRIFEKALFQARLLNAVGQAVIATDINGNITYWNRAAEQLYGWPEAEVLGRNIVDVTPAEYSREQAMDVMNRLRAGETWSGEFWARRRDNTLFPAIVTDAPIVDDKGERIGIIGVSTDITEQKWMQEVFNEAIAKVAELNDKLQVVESLTRHDVRNKLSALNGRIFLLKRRLTDNEEALSHLKDMELDARQMLKILEFERVYVQVGAEELSYISVEQSVNEAVSLFSDLKGAKLTNDCHGLTVLSDSVLRQLFYNLIDDSLKYGEKVSKIRVYYEEGEDVLKLIYEDDGVGVTGEFRNNLFREGIGKGTGYGLYLIKRICEAYGWTIQETGKQGQGVQFTISIAKANRNGKESYQTG